MRSAKPAKAPAQAAISAPAPPSKWVVPACDAPSGLSLQTLPTGGVLRWNGTGTALASAAGPSKLRDPNVGFASLVDVSTRAVARASLRGFVDVIPGSDSVLISGPESAVVSVDGQVWAGCRARDLAGAFALERGLVALAPSAVCDLKQQRLIRSAAGEPYSSPARRVAFWPGTSQLYWGGDSSSFSAWDAENGTMISPRALPETVLELARSADGQHLAMRLQDG